LAASPAKLGKGKHTASRLQSATSMPRKLYGFIHWHMVHADGAYASVRLHELLPCFPRRPVETCGGLTSSSQSPRGRPCCVPRATPVRPGRRLRGCTLLPHLTVERKEKAKRVFCFEKTALWQLEETLEVNETGLVGSCRFHCAKRGPKRTPIHSLRQFRLGFELQPPPLSGTTLAERLPLRIPGIHDYALLSATESSTHTDVIMVVVLRSRDAVSLRLASLA
jgi:hypothetical protein